jgi:NDP-sugar pyrophosphorylase family protein
MSPPASLTEIPVMILAGGLGTRLLGVISDRPKGLAPVGDRPFLEIQISLLRDQGFRRFVLCVGHRATQIRDCLADGDRLGVHIEYSVESETLLGTGGALRMAERFFEPSALVLNGDTYLAVDYRHLLADHAGLRLSRNLAATVAVARLDETRRFGTIVLDHTGRYLTGFHEKVPDAAGPAWLNAGAYVIERDLVERIPPGTPSSLERDVFPGALAAGLRLAAFPCQEPFFDIGTADDFQRFCRVHAAWAREVGDQASSRRAG